MSRGIIDYLSDFQSGYECVHIQHTNEIVELDMWGQTHNSFNTLNEYSKEIEYDEFLNRLTVKNKMHSFINDEHDYVILDGIVPENTEIRTSLNWIDGVMIVFYHKDGSETTVEFFS